MNVVKLADYRNNACDERITAREMAHCVAYLQQEAEKAGFEEVADLLAVVKLAAKEIPCA